MVALFALLPVYSRASSPDSSTKFLDILEPEQLQHLSEPILDDPNVRMAKLTLQDCISRALAHNLDIRISSYDPAIKLNDVIRAEAAFDAVLFGSAQWENADQANILSSFFTETTSTPGGTVEHKRPLTPFTKTEDYNYEVGLRKRMPTGGTLEVSQLLRRFRDEVNGDQRYYDPFYEFTLDVQWRQPLLRDFGLDVNRASINAARNNMHISQQQFHLQVIDTVNRVETAYWQLVQARQQTLIFRDLLERANADRHRQIARQEYDGKSTIIARSGATVSRFAANLVRSRNQLLQVQDQLLNLLNDPQLNITLKWELLTESYPSDAFYMVKRAEAIATAQQIRPEVLAQQTQIDTLDLLVGVSENQVLPRLDLLLQQEASGAGLTAGESFDTQNDLNTITYRGGLSFEVPLGGNRAARADLASAKNQRLQEILRLDRVKQQVAADVSIALNNLEAAHRELAARREAALQEENTLLSYQAQEDADAVITPEFLNLKIDTLDRVANAQVSLAGAVLSYNVAIVNLHRAQGTLLRYNNIKLAELP